MSGRTLITGAGGYLGGLLARRLVHNFGEPVVLWIHADNAAQAEAKIAPLRAAYAGHEALVTWAWGALEAEDPFAQIAPDDIRAIIHCAAVYRFNVAEEVARQVNVEGTRKVLDLAARCPQLEHVSVLSSFYASGLRQGVIAEAPFEPDDTAAFTNAYERSKASAEDEVLARQELPWNIYRVGLVIADDASGHVTQHNAFHQTLRLFHGGYLSVMPGDPTNRLYLVSGSFVARAVVDLVRARGRHQIVNVVHGPAHGVPLQVVLDTVMEAFQTDPGYRSRQLPRPIWTDQAGFELLVEGLASFGSPLVRKALQGVATFARQLFVHKVAENENLRQALPWYEPEDQAALIRQTCRHLVRSFARRGDQPPQQQTRE